MSDAPLIECRFVRSAWEVSIDGIPLKEFGLVRRFKMKHLALAAARNRIARKGKAHDNL